MAEGRKTILNRLLTFAALGGMSVAIVVLWIALRENPQGEFVDTQTGAIQLATYSLALAAGGPPPAPPMPYVTLSIACWRAGGCFASIANSQRAGTSHNSPFETPARCRRGSGYRSLPKEPKRLYPCLWLSHHRRLS